MKNQTKPTNKEVTKDYIDNNVVQTLFELMDEMDERYSKNLNEDGKSWKEYSPMVPIHISLYNKVTFLLTQIKKERGL